MCLLSKKEKKQLAKIKKKKRQSELGHKGGKAEPFFPACFLSRKTKPAANGFPFGAVVASRRVASAFARNNAPFFSGARFRGCSAGAADARRGGGGLREEKKGAKNLRKKNQSTVCHFFDDEDSLPRTFSVSGLFSCPPLLLFLLLPPVTGARRCVSRDGARQLRLCIVPGAGKGAGIQSLALSFACRSGRFRLAIPFLCLSFFLASLSLVALRSD